MSLLPHIGALILNLASVEVQPGTARPGDVVRISVHGSERAPDGTLGNWLLNFQKNGDGYEAVIAIPVDHEDGELDLAVTVANEGEEWAIEGDITIEPPHFPSRELHVDSKFISPTRAQRP